jgi:hypothetical protein
VLNYAPTKPEYVTWPTIGIAALATYGFVNILVNLYELVAL